MDLSGLVHRGWCSVILLLLSSCAWAQTKHLKGIVRDSHSEERVPFASIEFKHSTQGKLSDSAGNFSFHLSRWPSDTLLVTYVGFEDRQIALDTSKNELEIVVNLERGKKSGEVIVKSKIGRGLILWRKIVKNKPINDRARFNNYSYELYNKLEADLNNVNKEKLGRFTPGSLKFIYNNIDSVSEDKPFLPIYITETISDYFYQKSPKKYREEIRGSKMVGVNNESVAKLMGGMYQNVNVYNNFIPVFDKQFVSPISDNGDAYYNYRVPDTQYIGGHRFFHFLFTPKHKGENTFIGDAWIADSTFAVQKMNLRISGDANVNFITKLSLVQEYSLVNDSTWFLSKDKFVADFVLIGKKTISFTGRKTTTYRDVKINDSSVVANLNKNKIKEEIVMVDSAAARPDSFWINSRHEELSKNEKSIYKMVDTLQKMPAFIKATEMLTFIGTGYKNVGNYQIGPWYNWVTINAYEGLRLRFDLGTNTGFSKKLYLAGYLAYGFADATFKGRAEAMYMLGKHPRSYIYGSYTNDIDNGQTYYDEVGTDNLFAIAVRKPNIPYRYMHIEQMKFEYFKEWHNGISALFSTTRKIFNPLQNLPPKEYYPSNEGNQPLDNYEVSVRLRFAYLEKFLENNFFRTSLGSDYPILEFKYAKGIPGVFNSNYDYYKLSASISDYMKIAPFGSLYYNVYAGKVYGTLPYMLLEVHPGNNLWYYNKYAFNLMTRYEYLSDQYAGINVEHNIGNGLFRLIPITRKLKFRQFWQAKLLIGSLSQANQDYNFVNGYTFKTLNGKPYLELGTGVDNIFKVFRLDFIWRVLPQPLPPESYARFGVFFSFHLGF